MSLLKENFGFLLGVIAATLVILLPSPDGLSTEGHKTCYRKTNKFGNSLDESWIYSWSNEY